MAALYGCCYCRSLPHFYVCIFWDCVLFYSRNHIIWTTLGSFERPIFQFFRSIDIFIDPLFELITVDFRSISRANVGRHSLVQSTYVHHTLNPRSRTIFRKYAMRTKKKKKIIGGCDWLGINETKANKYTIAHQRFGSQRHFSWPIYEKYWMKYTYSHLNETVLRKKKRENNQNKIKGNRITVESNAHDPIRSNCVIFANISFSRFSSGFIWSVCARFGGCRSKQTKSVLLVFDTF